MWRGLEVVGLRDCFSGSLRFSHQGNSGFVFEMGVRTAIEALVMLGKWPGGPFKV